MSKEGERRDGRARGEVHAILPTIYFPKYSLFLSISRYFLQNTLHNTLVTLLLYSRRQSAQDVRSQQIASTV